MMLGWAVHATIVAALLGTAAFLVERALRLHGRPARGVWVLALAGSFLLPAGRLLVPAAPAPATGVGIERSRVVATPVGTAEEGALSVLTAALEGGAALLERAAEVPALVAGRVASTVPDPLDGAGGFGLLWALASLAVAIVIGLSIRRLRRERRGWTPRRLDEVEVLVSEDRGPGVVGLRRAAIVVPRWVLGLEAGLRRLICLHEREHLRAGDHRLFAAALAAVALVPWNLPLWWQLRRLRLAVECDCDRRVLRRGVSRRLYGELLLRVSERLSRLPLVAAPFAERKSLLERRIRTMTSDTARHRIGRSLAAAVAAIALVAVSCESPAPMENGEEIAATEQDRGLASRATLEGQPLVIVDGEVVDREASFEDLDPDDIARVEVVKGAEAREMYGERGEHGVIEITTKDATGREAEPGERDAAAPSFIPYDTPPKLRNAEVVQRALQVAYPRDLRDAGVGGRAVLWVRVDASGQVERVRVRTSTGRDALDRAAVEVARSMEFSPARNDGEPTPVWVTQPVTFDVDGGEASGRSSAGESRSLGEIVTSGATQGEGTEDGYRVRIRGDGSKIRIRGATSIEASDAPRPLPDALYLLDGEVVEDAARLESLDHETIHSIEIVKGPAARELYGERGAEGVIIIKTKAAASGTS